MAFNGFRRNGESVAEDETPTKQPRSSKEMPGCSAPEADDEAASSAGRGERTSGSTARQGPDSVKKTRPRRCYCWKRGLSIFTGKRGVARLHNWQRCHEMQILLAEMFFLTCLLDSTLHLAIT